MAANAHRQAHGEILERLRARRRVEQSTTGQANIRVAVESRRIVPREAGEQEALNRAGAPAEKLRAVAETRRNHAVQATANANDRDSYDSVSEESAVLGGIREHAEPAEISEQVGQEEERVAARWPGPRGLFARRVAETG